jgi:hypothetical protein
MDSSSASNGSGGEPSFQHHVAIQLSRLLNLPTNDLLAKRVIDIATSTSLRAFENGKHSLIHRAGLFRPSGQQDIKGMDTGIRSLAEEGASELNMC